MDETRQRYLLKNKTCVAEAMKEESRRVQEELTI